MDDEELKTWCDKYMDGKLPTRTQAKIIRTFVAQANIIIHLSQISSGKTVVFKALAKWMETL